MTLSFCSHDHLGASSDLATQTPCPSRHARDQDRTMSGPHRSVRAKRATSKPYSRPESRKPSVRILLQLDSLQLTHVTLSSLPKLSLSSGPPHHPSHLILSREKSQRKMRMLSCHLWTGRRAYPRRLLLCSLALRFPGHHRQAQRAARKGSTLLSHQRLTQCRTMYSSTSKL